MTSTLKLAAKDTKHTETEKEVMKEYFADNEAENDEEDASKKSGKGFFQSFQWKTTAIALAIFLVLANPWIDGVLCYTPYCGGNPLTLFGLKALLFFIILLLTLKFV
jgi:hypothetical protein